MKELKNKELTNRLGLTVMVGWARSTEEKIIQALPSRQPGREVEYHKSFDCCYGMQKLFAWQNEIHFGYQDFINSGLLYKYK